LPPFTQTWVTMEKDFIKIFNGLERNYGYIKDIGSSKHTTKVNLKQFIPGPKKKLQIKIILII